MRTGRGAESARRAAMLGYLLAVQVIASCGGETNSDGAKVAVGGTGGAALPSGGDATARGGAGVGGTASGGRATGGAPTGGTSVGPPTGGTAMGGEASGGTATGGAPCIPVASLPDVGSACGVSGESQCDSPGHRCYCSTGIWNCNYPCPATTSGSCPLGLSCIYPSGPDGEPITLPYALCRCVASQWQCVTLD